MNRSEFEDAYEDVQSLRGEILTTPISALKLRPPSVVQADDRVSDAVEAMRQHHFGCVLVLRSGNLAGIFTERDVLNRVAFRPETAEAKVGSVMTADPETLTASASIAFALNKMSVGGYRHIPIVDDEGKPAAVLSVRDIVGFLVELFPDAVLNLPPTPEQGIAKSAEGG